MQVGSDSFFENKFVRRDAKDVMVRLDGVDEKFRLRARGTNNDLTVRINDFLLHEHGVAETKRFAGNVDFFKSIWFPLVETLRPERVGKMLRTVG